MTLEFSSRQQNAIAFPALANEVYRPRKQLLDARPVAKLFPFGALVFSAV